jgi:1-acyl-sn-glycerol-3-phosphate acyltransferase
MSKRRLLTIPGTIVAWSLWIGATPLWLPLALGLDAMRRRQAVAWRCAALLSVYLCCEMIGIVASGALWLWQRLAQIDDERWTDLHYRLEAWWGTTLFRAVVRIFGLRVEVEGDADLGRGPYLLLLRHSSSGDTLLASALVSAPHGLRLRYVLKDELLWDPCLDIVGNRLPNVFVDRFSQDSARETQRVQELARNLGPRDAVLIYPEGTRFSPAKRRRALDHFHRKGDAKMLEVARSLAWVLPPRSGGTLALLEADVVLCAHTGFEGAASLASLWEGALVHQVIRVQFRRIPRSAIPATRDARNDWILEEWRRVDAWVESRQSPQLGPDGSEAKASRCR